MSQTIPVRYTPHHPLRYYTFICPASTNLIYKYDCTLKVRYVVYTKSTLRIAILSISAECGWFRSVDHKFVRIRRMETIKEGLKCWN